MELKTFKQSKTKLKEPNPVEIVPIKMEIRMRDLVVDNGTKNCNTIENQVE